MKFKNIKKKTYKKKFPSNSRTITDGVKFSFSKIDPAKMLKLYGGALKFFVIFIFIIAVIIVGLDLQNNLKVKQEIDSQRKVLDLNLDFWEDFISKHQNYPDAYFQASILKYRLGNSTEAKAYLKKGLSLSPNSENGRKVEAFLADK